MEDFAVEALADAGFDAKLNIVSVSQTQAKIRDIRLNREGREVIRADELRIDYIWPDIREGKTKRLEFDGAKATLRLGDDWQPSDGWLVDILAGEDQPEDTPQQIGFPERGVLLSDATLNLISPLGTAVIFADAEIASPEIFDLDLTLAPSDLSYRGFGAKGAGVVELNRDGQSLTIDGQVQTQTLSNPNISTQDAYVQIKGAVNLETSVFNGTVAIDGQAIKSQPFAADAVRLDWDGDISRDETIQAKGQWTVNATQARIPDPARAVEVASTLSLFPALSVVPVTENFAPDIRRTVRDFLVGSDISGRGQLDYGPDGFTVIPAGPLDVKTVNNALILSPDAGETFYSFDRSAQTVRARMDAAFTRPVGLTLKNIDLQAASPNGYSLSGIKRFAARVATQGDWLAKTQDGQGARLGPTSTRVIYLAGETSPRQLSLDTGLDYDGPLPGGRVEQLNLKGRVDVRLFENRQVLDFTPAKDARLTLAKLETPTAWTAENLAFSLPPTRNIFIRTSARSNLAATLISPDFDLTRPANETSPAQRLKINAGKMTVGGTLLPSGQQDWAVDFEAADYLSDTLPGPGTTASVRTARLLATLAPDTLPQISFESDSVQAATPLVQVKNMRVALNGTPETYVVTHSGGTVKLIGSAAAGPAQAAGFAQFPADGRVSFEGGKFQGQARLRVVKADNATVDIDYIYADGAGTAEIDVPSIWFSPDGLQPQNLLPALKGKIARVTGETRARFNVAFSDGLLTESAGYLDLINMDIGTAPGPLSGVNTSIRFTSLWPLETAGDQRLTMKSFNPGLELKDGEMTYRLTQSGVKVEQASWPIGNGSLSLDPFTWNYAAEENRVVMRVRDVELGDFLEDVGNRKIDATGNVVGVFPIVIRGVQVLVEAGQISVPDGGIIKYDSAGPGRNYTQEEALEIFREQRSSEYSAIAQDALKEFNYRSLTAGIDGPLDGEVTVGLAFDGSNPKVLNSQPFRFDITVKGELINIARSFNSNAQIKSEVLRQTGLQAE